MGNLIQMERFHCDELSEQANDFINNYRARWNNFIVQAHIAVVNDDQDRLNEAINRLAPYLIEAGAEDEGKSLWEELWSWVVRSNKGKWKVRSKQHKEENE